MIIRKALPLEPAAGLANTAGMHRAADDAYAASTPLATDIR